MRSSTVPKKNDDRAQSEGLFLFIDTGRRGTGVGYILLYRVQNGIFYAFVYCCKVQATLNIQSSCKYWIGRIVPCKLSIINEV
jgi:hypothetical protein